MTSSDLNGDNKGQGGRLPAMPARPAGAAPMSAPSGIPVFGPMGAGAVPGLGGIDLPAGFSTQRLLDPGFLTGMANEFFADGLPFADAEGGLRQAAEFASQAVRTAEALDGPCLRFLSAEEQMPGSLSGLLPDVPSVPASSAGEAFYFLANGGLAPAMAAEEVPFYFLQGPAGGTAVPTGGMAPRSFDVEAIRRDFPILHQQVHGKPLIWLDNAATTQKPQAVIDAVSRFYERDNSNIHRAAHTLAARATQAYEDAREKVRRFLGAGQVEEIVFVRGCTEGVNLVAQTFGRKMIGPGDEIVLTTLEHHSNIVPWFHLAKEKGAVLRVAPVNDRGEIILEEYERLLGPRTRLVAMSQVSNALGTVLPVQTMTQLAHRHGATVLIDGAQSVPHLAIDVQALDCDFFVFSGHKLFGPTGIGAVFGKRALLESLPPWQGGGNMIDQVTFEEVTYQSAPMRFEAGTGILAGAVGLGAAIDYVQALGMERIARHEHDLLVHATEGLGQVPGLRLIGTAADKASVVSFVLEGVRTEDMGRYLDREGIAVRAGHHCAQPALRRFGLTSTVRPSLAFYNTHAEVDALVAAVRRARDVV